MANNKPGKFRVIHKSEIVTFAAKAFFEQGYTNTTINYLKQELGISTGYLTNLFSSKEEILAALVDFMFEEQFSVARSLVAGLTDDPVLFYATDTALQLYVVESAEKIRDLYMAAYSLKAPAKVIQDKMTEKLPGIFGTYRPELKPTDYYKLEIASGGIIRGFMSVPCDVWFDIDQKVDAFLDASLLIYRIPEEKIAEAKEFVKQFDFPSIVEKAVSGIFAHIDERIVALKG